MSEAKTRPMFFHAPKQRNIEWPVYTLGDVAKHAHKDDCWIVVQDKVYDMTKHVQNHEGWIGGGKVSTLIALLCSMGIDCTEDVLMSHDSHAMRQIASFQIGVLDQPNEGSRLVNFMTWDQLEDAGFDASVARHAAFGAR